MRCSARRPRLSLLVVVLTALPMTGLANDDPVDVEFTNGRRVEAVIDPRTDGDFLWLTTPLEHGHISRSVPWAQVRHVDIGGQKYERRIVQAAVATIRDAVLPDAVESPTRHLVRLDSRSLGPVIHGSGPSAIGQAERPADHGARTVQAMSVSAWLGNWDADVPEDGLVVELTLYDSWGNRLDCDGTAEFVLRTWKNSGRARQFGMRSERWIRTIRRSNFVSGCVTVQLPFRTIQPETSSEWWPHGALQVRLAAPGSGVVERTVTDLRVRPFEPTRDMLEQLTGDRYFPSERVRHQRQSPFPH